MARTARRRMPRRPRNIRRKQPNVRTISRVYSNAIVPVRMPNDPVKRALTGERHHVTRLDLIAAGGKTGLDFSAHSFSFLLHMGSNDTATVNVADLLAMNAKLYGESPVAIAVKSVKVWGPDTNTSPDTKAHLWLYAGPHTAPQSVEDSGTQMSRAKVGLRVPQLYWMSSADADTTVFKATLYSAPWPTSLKRIGVIDVSWVARRV